MGSVGAVIKMRSVLVERTTVGGQMKADNLHRLARPTVVELCDAKTQFPVVNAIPYPVGRNFRVLKKGNEAQEVGAGTPG